MLTIFLKLVFPVTFKLFPIKIFPFADTPPLICNAPDDKSYASKFPVKNVIEFWYKLPAIIVEPVPIFRFPDKVKLPLKFPPPRTFKDDSELFDRSIVPIIIEFFDTTTLLTVNVSFINTFELIVRSL